MRGVIRPFGDAQTRARRAAVGLRLVTVGCVAVGVWLMVIGVLYTDWLSLAVATASILFGVAELRSSPRTVRRE